MCSHLAITVDNIAQLVEIYNGRILMCNIDWISLMYGISELCRKPHPHPDCSNSISCLLSRISPSNCPDRAQTIAGYMQIQTRGLCQV